jgi:hypothetical protein
MPAAPRTRPWQVAGSQRQLSTDMAGQLGGGRGAHALLERDASDRGKQGPHQPHGARVGGHILGQRLRLHTRLAREGQGCWVRRAEPQQALPDTQISTAACSALRTGRPAPPDVTAASECPLWRLGYQRPALRAAATLAVWQGCRTCLCGSQEQAAAEAERPQGLQEALDGRDVDVDEREGGSQPGAPRDRHRSLQGSALADAPLSASQDNSAQHSQARQRR